MNITNNEGILSVTFSLEESEVLSEEFEGLKDVLSNFIKNRSRQKIYNTAEELAKEMKKNPNFEKEVKKLMKKDK